VLKPFSLVGISNRYNLHNQVLANVALGSVSVSALSSSNQLRRKVSRLIPHWFE
jgi:hypothetical protein